MKSAHEVRYMREPLVRTARRDASRGIRDAIKEVRIALDKVSIWLFKVELKMAIKEGRHDRK